jgi:hypothetical protein
MSTPVYLNESLPFSLKLGASCGAAALFVLIALRTHSHAGGGPGGGRQKNGFHEAHLDALITFWSFLGL